LILAFLFASVGIFLIYYAAKPIIFRVLDQSESLTKFAIDTTMVPDGATTLREPIKPRLSSRLRYATPLGLFIGFAIDEHDSTSCLHQPALIQKKIPS
jgi:hypothetical protein